MNFFTPRNNIVVCLVFSWLTQLYAMPQAPQKKHASHKGTSLHTAHQATIPQNQQSMVPQTNTPTPVVQTTIPQVLNKQLMVPQTTSPAPVVQTTMPQSQPQQTAMHQTNTPIPVVQTTMPQTQPQQLTTPQTISGTPVVAEQLTWPNTIELSEQNHVMISNPAIAQCYAKAEQTCKAMVIGLKTLEQTIDSIRATTNQKLQASSAIMPLINVDIGKLQELFNPKETK